jgi:uncharacterized membrane protein YedE/YeeE
VSVPRSVAATDHGHEAPRVERVRARELLVYVVLGTALGLVLVKSEVVSWYRIQEMFRFDSFHMYGILGSAWLTALISLRLLARYHARAVTGEHIALAPKALERGHRYWLGGGTFGVGWALSGACPGPLFALIGSGPSVYLITALSALLGAWTYGAVRDRLPH